MKRRADWHSRLVRYLSECAVKPFRPGRLDCGLFFSGAVKAMTGKIIDKPFRGKYRTLAKAQEIAESLGFKDHVEYAAQFFDELENPIFANSGDGAVVTDMDGNPALGIVQGEYIYVMQLNGLGLVPLTDIKRAFRV